MRTILVVIAISLAAIPAFGQSALTPIISECSAKCSGDFTVTNDSLLPVATMLRPVSFTVSADGMSHFSPLDSTIHVLLSENSARIGPKQSHSFSYRVTCDALPCFLTIYAVVTAKHSDGLTVEINLPHTIYACEKSKNCRASVRKSVFHLAQ